MAAKKAKAKTTAKRAAPKGKASAKKAKASAKPKPKTSAKASAKPKAKAAVKAKAKPASKRTAKPAKQPVAAVEAPPAQTSLPIEMEPYVDTAPVEAKKGTLARLAGGVGNLIARMTGKKAAAPDEPVAEPPPAVSPDATMALADSDILAATAQPPPTPKPKS